MIVGKLEVLESVRKEIQERYDNIELSPWDGDDYNTAQVETLEWVLGILDKYKQESKTGHWINIDDAVSECSECGHREPNERFIFEDINFCAKCGVKMEGINNDIS